MRRIHLTANGMVTKGAQQTAGVFVKRPFIRVTLVIILFAGAAIIVIGALVRHAAGRKLRRRFLGSFNRSL